MIGISVLHVSSLGDWPNQRRKARSAVDHPGTSRGFWVDTKCYCSSQLGAKAKGATVPVAAALLAAAARTPDEGREFTGFFVRGEAKHHCLGKRASKAPFRGPNRGAGRGQHDHRRLEPRGPPRPGGSAPFLSGA